MALGATIYRFLVTLSDVDRGVYESLDVRAARHPSESARYLLTRTLAYCLSYEEGIAFSKGGISSTDEPPLSIRDATGARVRTQLFDEGTGGIETHRREVHRQPQVGHARPDVPDHGLRGAALRLRQPQGLLGAGAPRGTDPSRARPPPPDGFRPLRRGAAGPHRAKRAGSVASRHNLRTIGRLQRCPETGLGTLPPPCGEGGPAKPGRVGVGRRRGIPHPSRFDRGQRGTR